MRQYISRISYISFILAAIFPYITLTAKCCGWSSNEIALNLAGNAEGPKMNLSATILSNGESLNYYCIQPDASENGIGGSNRFEYKGETGDWKSIGSEAAIPGQIRANYKLCEADRQYLCSHVWGTVSFNSPGKAGQYRCTSLMDSPQTVYWYKNEVRGTPVNVSREQHGGVVVLTCNIPIAPAWLSYEDILDVTWEIQNRRHNNYWRSVTSETADFRVVFPDKGANVKLQYQKFRPQVSGGNYRCNVAFKPRGGSQLGTLQSTEFKVDAEAKATLTNSLSRKAFLFGLGESVTLNCSVEAYPFVDEIALTLMRDGQQITNPSWTPYGDTTVLSKLDYHYASISISNVTAEELNGTTLTCVGRRNGLSVCSYEQSIQVDVEAPDTTVPEDQQPPAAKRPWVVAISVIIPIIIILLLVIAAVWWCNRESDDEDYRSDAKEDGEDEELRT